VAVDDIFDVLKTKIIEALAPMLDTGGGPLKQIFYQDFDSAADVETLLQRFTQQSPGGYLSYPRVLWQQRGAGGAGGTRKIAFTVAYSFASVTGNQQSEEREDFLHDVLRIAVAAIVDLILDVTDAGTDWGVQEIRLGAGTPFESEELLAYVIEFTVIGEQAVSPYTT